jgi:hypothetical protein
MELNEIMDNIIASNTLQESNDAEWGPAQVNPWLKVKTITFTTRLVGTIRVKRDIKTASATFGNLDHQIRRNGTLIGTEQKCRSESWETFSDDITQDWGPGDTIELWMWSRSGWAAAARNFRVYYDMATSFDISFESNPPNATIHIV